MEKIRFIYHIIRTIINSVILNIGYMVGSESVTLSPNCRNIIVLGIPHHQNIGDQAIVLAEQYFLKQYFPSDNVILIPEVGLEKYLRSVKRQLSADDLVMYHGGGNLGSLYPFAERRRRFSILKLRRFKVVLFPQSIYFESTSMGDFEKRRCQKVYNQAINLVLVVREQESLNRAAAIFPDCRIIIVPDIVFSLLSTRNVQAAREPFENGLTALRTDQESSLNQSFQRELLTFMQHRFRTVDTTDTMAKLDIEINANNRVPVVNEKWREFLASDVVVTDRLHGTLFAILNRRPCVVFDNNNHKVGSTILTWLKDYEGIVIVKEKTIDAVREAISELEHADLNDGLNLDKEFEPLLRVME